MDYINASASFCKIVGHSKEVSSCAFNQEYFVTCSGDKSVRVYSTQDFNEKPYSPLLTHKYAVNCVTFDTNGCVMASASTDGTTRLWNIKDDNASVSAIFRHSNSNTVQVCSFSPNSSMLVTGSSDGAIGVWNIDQKKELFQFIGHPEGNVNAAAFSPCSDYLVTGSGVGDVRVWDLRYNEFCILQTQAHDKGVSGCGVDCICFSPSFHVISEEETADSYLMATCGQDNQVKLWLFQRSIASQSARKKDHSSRCLQPLQELTGHHGPVSKCCFSPDGAKMASSSFDKTVIIWNPITAERLMILDGHTAIVTCVAFSWDGKFLASTSYDKTTIVWKLAGHDDIMDGQDCSAPPVESSVVEDLASLNVNDEASTSVLPVSQMDKPVDQWTKDDVVKWLEEVLKLTRYSKSFKENEIDGDELVNLTAEVLSQDLGVSPLGHRNKILRGIKAVQSKKSLSSQDFVSPSQVGQGRSPVFLPATTAVTTFVSNSTSPTVRATPKVSIDDSNVPDEYICPISREVMMDPVLAADGFSYERSEIENWFRRGSMMSPMTNKKLSSRNLISNQALKTIIMQFLESKA